MLHYIAIYLLIGIIFAVIFMIENAFMDFDTKAKVAFYYSLLLLFFWPIFIIISIIDYFYIMDAKTKDKRRIRKLYTAYANIVHDNHLRPVLDFSQLISLVDSDDKCDITFLYSIKNKCLVAYYENENNKVKIKVYTNYITFYKINKLINVKGQSYIRCKSENIYDDIKPIIKRLLNE